CWLPIIHRPPQTPSQKHGPVIQAADAESQPDKSRRCSKSNCDICSTPWPASLVPAEVVELHGKVAVPAAGGHWLVPANRWWALERSNAPANRNLQAARRPASLAQTAARVWRQVLLAEVLDGQASRIQISCTLRGGTRVRRPVKHLFSWLEARSSTVRK